MVDESTPAGFDFIEGFESGSDRVDLGRIDADVHAPGNQAFRFIGDAAFGGLGPESAGELRASYNGALERWEVEGDVDGDGAADLMIVFPDAEVLAAGDFIL